MENIKKKVLEFLKKYKKIVIVLLIWLVIIIINFFIGKKNINKNDMTNTYQPHESIMNSSVKVPDNLQPKIEQLIGEYVEYCNNKEYEKAYNLLTEECKKELYPTLEDFTLHIKSIFDQYKVYSMQNYSNDKNLYIYRVTFFNDILSNGISRDNKDTQYDEEKFVIKNNNGNLSLSIGGFISEETLNKLYEDDNMRVYIEKRILKYDTEEYILKIANKSQYILYLSDYIHASDIQIELPSGGTRNFYVSDDMKNNGYIQTDMYIYSQQIREYRLIFNKFYDESKDTKSINFNSIKLLTKIIDYDEMTQDSEYVEAIYNTKIKL